MYRARFGDSAKNTYLYGVDKIVCAVDKIVKRLEVLTGKVLTCKDPSSEEGLLLLEELRLIQELSKTHSTYEKSTVPDERIKQRLDLLTRSILTLRNVDSETLQSYVGELKVIQELAKTWHGADGIEINAEEAERERKSSKLWDAGAGTLTTQITLTTKQREALQYLDSGLYDKFLALGGSGSGKSFILAYKVVRDTLRHRAPSLVARNVYEDLKQGMIDQIIPAILQLIAQANGQEKWETWQIDGLRFAKYSDKRTKLDFATGGYLRFAGLSARDLSESGSDKILSPSWLHVLLEEVSELDYDIVEKLITRLRLHIKGVLNVMMMCENPPSINHWTYKRFFEHKREDGSVIEAEELSQMKHMLMNPKDNIENLGETYVRNLSQMTGANKERFYEGRFQDTEMGDIFKRMDWTDNLPRSFDYEKIVVYTDPTPLTEREHSVYADYKASVLLGLYCGETYIIDVRVVRGSTTDMLTGMKQLWDISPNQSITDVVMENKAIPSDFNQVLAKFTATTGWVCPIKLDKRKFGEKKGAIETFLQPLFDTDMIHFNEAFRHTERGAQTQLQILKFSRKSNKNIHDDIPDAIMKADTYVKGKQGKKRKRSGDQPIVTFVRPAFING